MIVRKATEGDLHQILQVISDAKIKMRRSGNMKQWTDGYPSRAAILADIARGVGYVCTTDDAGKADASGKADATGKADETIEGYFAMIPGVEPTYLKIYEGRWLSNDPYVTIHRIGSRLGAKGVLNAAIKAVADFHPEYNNIRIDTHRDNSIMQHVLEKAGFKYCGIIYLLSGDERLAFQNN